MSGQVLFHWGLESSVNSYFMEIMFPLGELQIKYNKYFINILENNKLGEKINCKKWVGVNIISAVESG